MWWTINVVDCEQNTVLKKSAPRRFSLAGYRVGYHIALVIIIALVIVWLVMICVPGIPSNFANAGIYFFSQKKLENFTAFDSEGRKNLSRVSNQKTHCESSKGERQVVCPPGSWSNVFLNIGQLYYPD